MSMQDKGGRSQWHGYSAAASSGAGGSGSGFGANKPTASSTSTSAQISTSATKTATPGPDVSPYAAPTYQAGYAPARTPSPKVKASTTHTMSMPPAAATPANAAPTSTTPTVASMSAQGNSPVVTRVRALHTFEPTEPGELAFEKGDVIKVVDRGYKDWWRGQLKGRTGIFPVNYVVSTHRLPCGKLLILYFSAGTATRTYGC